MAFNAYRNILVEEEKFLKQMQRNLQDQLNRLKIEELSLLKLISMSDPRQYEQQFDSSIDSIGQSFAVPDTESKKSKVKGSKRDVTGSASREDADTPTPSVHFDINEKLLDMEQNVNSLPLLDLQVNITRTDQQMSQNVQDEEMEEEEEDEEEG